MTDPHAQELLPCPKCKGDGGVLHFYDRGPNDAPGNQWVPCDECKPQPRSARTAEGYAALAYKGDIIVNSIRDTRDAVRLAAGECMPVKVRIVQIEGGEDE